MSNAIRADLVHKRKVNCVRNVLSVKLRSDKCDMPSLTVTNTDMSCAVITFRVSRRRREMYCGHALLCVCVSVRGRMPAILHGPGCNLGE